MDQLKLASDFLKRRGFKAEKINKTFLKQLGEVVPLSEVVAVLDMVEKGEFEKWYNDMKEKRGGRFP